MTDTTTIRAPGAGVGTSVMVRTARVCALVLIGAIVAASFVLSFAALRDLAVLAHTPRGLAFLWPVIVDCTIVQATVAVFALAPMHARRSTRLYFWCVLAAGAVVSLTGNAMHAAAAEHALSPHAAIGVAVVPPISLLAATHGMALLLGVRPGAGQPVDTKPATAPVSDPPTGAPEGHTTTPTPGTDTPAPTPAPVRGGRRGQQRAPAGRSVRWAARQVRRPRLRIIQDHHELRSRSDQDRQSCRWWRGAGSRDPAADAHQQVGPGSRLREAYAPAACEDGPCPT